MSFILTIIGTGSRKRTLQYDLTNGGRCWMDRTRAEVSLSQPVLCGDFQTANGVGAACMEHSMEDGYADARFNLLAREASCSQARTDDGLVTAHRGFNQSPLSVVSLFLPTQSSLVCNGKNMPVSL
jgi:hypothetical protein